MPWDQPIFDNTPLHVLAEGDYMPFGKYEKEDKRMRDVPAWYLIWLWNEGLKDETRSHGDRGAVARYIEANADTLREEAPDKLMDRFDC